MNNKILTRKDITALCHNFHSEGKTLGFTSGVFDLLHEGHVDYLQKSKAYCDVLIVALNSDSSVRALKGEKRPIQDQHTRAEIIAALESVDYVFLFDEKNNNTNVELLKPNFYFKAGDYNPEKLSSKPLVEKAGGEIKIIPDIKNSSTSNIIQTILDRYAGPIILEGDTVQKEPTPAVFVDRDGTINKDIEYLHEPEKVEILSGALSGLKAFVERGYKIIIITNQPGIGFGYFTKEDLFRVNREILSHCFKEGVMVDGIFFCPHTKAEGCSCRKPGTQLLERAIEQFAIVPEQSIFIGDTAADIACGKSVGCRTLFVTTGKNSDPPEDPEPDIIASSIEDGANKFFSTHS